MGIGQPTVGGNIPKDESYLIRRIEALETFVKQSLAAGVLRAATISGGAGQGLRTEDFNGTSFASPGTVGNYFGAEGAVLGNLFLRPGTVNNDALVSPVSPFSVHADAQSFALSTTMTVKATATVTVPSGFSTALVMAVSQVTARNSTTVQDFLGVGIAIAGVVTPGWAASADALATASIHPVVTGTSAGTAFLTGLGSSFTVQTRAQSGGASWASDVFNTANIDAIVLFLR